MPKKLYSILVLLLLGMKLIAAPGDWTQFLSMKKTFKVVEGNGIIYFASEGGIFYYNLNDYSIETLTKIDGLSESEIRTIGYNKDNSTLIVAYKNSCIDLVYEDGTIFPITDIKRKNIQGDNSIHNMQQYGDICYLACGFGIVALDVKKQEIKDTYLIGSNGGYLPVNDVAVFNNNLYAATEEGMKYAPLNENLLDYSNWAIIGGSDGLPEKEFYLVEATDLSIFCIDRNQDKDYGNVVYTMNENNKWSKYWIDIYSFKEFKIKNNKVIVPGSYHTNVLDLTDKSVTTLPRYSFLSDSDIQRPYSALEDEEGNIWVADYNHGAILINNNTQTQIIPDGPIDNSIFKLTYTNNKLWISKGGFSDTRSNEWLAPILQSYGRGNWNTYDRTVLPQWENRSDVTIVTGVPNSENHIWVSLWGSGIFEIKNNKIVNFFNDENSPLNNIIPGQRYVRVEGMTYDDEGNLWVTNGNVNQNLHCLKPDSTWESYYLPEIANSYSVGKIIHTRDDNLWMIIPRGKTNGLYVMSSDGTQKKSLDVASYFTNGDDIVITKMNDVFDIVEDLEGEIWVATTQGITTYSSPYYVFSENPYYAYQPGLNLNDGIYHPLLSTETVTCLAVDGGNRKYCGTANSGLFLISENGEKEIANYTTENSPLLSNNITSLAYDGDNGILYIGCQGGLVALTTDSKTGASSFEEIYAYPNPVREDYEGDIYITGLMENTTVKITTVSGRLVYQTTSEGGQAVWPGTDLNGNRVHTGVYLAMCSANDGEDSAITKILFIR